MCEVLQDPTAALPYEVSTLIFSFIPAHDLVKNCALVCQHWRSLSEDQTTWRLKCEHTGRYAAQCLRNYQPDDWKKFYYENPFRRNLLRNPTLADAFPNIATEKSGTIHPWAGYSNMPPDDWARQFAPWHVHNIGGNGLCVECPPIGSPSLPSEAGTTCLATSYDAFVRSQVIDLVKAGIPEYVLDECCLPIYACEWFNARFDCGCKYYMKVTLRDGKQNKLNDFKVKLENEKAEGHQDWEKLEHTFYNYPPGVRYIYFKDYGQDSKFWRGHYGAKLAGGTVNFLLHK